MRVAVVGAGPAGLVTARELLRRNCDVTVYEAAALEGGVWVYDDAVEPDLSSPGASAPVSCSLYASLRTNIPRDLMAFLDYTFDSKGGGDDKWARYPHHSEVLEYLRNFSRHFGIQPRIRFKDPVQHISRAGSGWCITSGKSEEKYEAVAICNGHYSRPRVPDLPGVEHFRGRRMHSHSYRRPDAFKGKRVALWGTSASGFDIANEIAEVAAHTHWCGNAFDVAMHLNKRSHWPSVRGFSPSGRLLVADTELEIDVFMYCTGYLYEFPFLDSIVSVEDNLVSPLYQDILPTGESTLGFIGIPYLVIPFPLFEMQATWFAEQLTGAFELPGSQQQKKVVSRKLSAFKDSGELNRHFHRLGDQQFDYYDTLAEQCGHPPIPDWFKETWADTVALRQDNPRNYRDLPLAVRGPTVCS